MALAIGLAELAYFHRSETPEGIFFSVSTIMSEILFLILLIQMLYCVATDSNRNEIRFMNEYGVSSIEDSSKAADEFKFGHGDDSLPVFFTKNDKTYTGLIKRDGQTVRLYTINNNKLVEVKK